MSNIEDQVCSDIQTRASIGLSKYGTTVERTDLSQSEWVQHAYEEALDMAVYLKRLQAESCSLSKDDLRFILKVVDEAVFKPSAESHPTVKAKAKEVLIKIKADLKLV